MIRLHDKASREDVGPQRHDDEVFLAGLDDAWEEGLAQHPVHFGQVRDVPRVVCIRLSTGRSDDDLPHKLVVLVGRPFAAHFLIRAAPEF